MSARERFERQEALKKLINISSDGEGYQVNLVQGENDWDLIACLPHVDLAEHTQWAICRFVEKQMAAREAECEGLREALRGLLYLTDQGREGGMILSRYDHKPITNGDQDIIDKAFIRAESALSGKPTGEKR